MDRFLDWLFYFLFVENGNEVIFEVVIEDGLLWFYFVVKDGEKYLLREVRWVFQEGDDVDVEIWVGVYVVKFIFEVDGFDKGIEVEFRDFKLEMLGQIQVNVVDY